MAMETDILPRLGKRKFSQKGEATYQRMLECAETHFAARGYAATRMEDIAQAVDVKRAAISYFFPNKLSLYLSVVESVCTGLVEKVEKVIAEHDDPINKMEAMFEVWIHFLVERPTAYRLIMRQLGGEEEPVDVGHWSLAIDIVDNVLKQANAACADKPVDVEKLVATACGPTFMYLAFQFMRADFDPKQKQFRTELGEHIEQIKQTVRDLFQTG